MDILLVGDSCQDVFCYGRSERLCPEAPVPVFIPENSVTAGGMIHNVAYHLSQMGVEYSLRTGNSRSVKTRFIDKKTNHMFMRLDEHDMCFEGFDAKPFLQNHHYDAVIISDYGKGYLCQYAIEWLIGNVEYSFVDTKKKLGSWLKDATFVKINALEWKLSGSDEVQGILHHNLVVTEGEGGCRFQGVVYRPRHVEDVVDTSGAGDVFLAGLAAKYLECKSAGDAIHYAMKAAGQVVKVRGVKVELNLLNVEKVEIL